VHDLTPVLDLFAAAEEARDGDALRRATVDALARLLRCDHVLWTEIDTRTTAVVAAIASGVGPVDLREPAAWDALSRSADHDGVLRLALAGAGTTTVGIAMHRDGTGFDDGDRALLARLRPVLGFVVREALAAPSPQAALTAREGQILRLVARGESNDAVGLALGISTRTVEKHLEHVYRKLRVRGRYEALASARSSSVRP
jgi:DNA-binding CsgD family transcriptional regulator